MSHKLNLEDKDSLLETLRTSEGKSAVASLRGDRAEAALTLLQKELDTAGKRDDTEFRAKVIRVMTHLANASDRFPTDLWLSNVDRGVEIRRGAQGKVFKGSWNGRKVALKFPYGKLDSKIEKQFCQEALLWRQLSHKNILRFLGLYQDGPEKAMVSEWKYRGNAVDYLTNGEVSGMERYKLLIQAADGLTYLHKHEPMVIHGDLKPENILIGKDNAAVLADFGLAHIQHDLTGLVSSTSTGTGGTLCYMAPELLEGSKSTGSSDIWALGMVIYMVFTGKTPYLDRKCVGGVTMAIKDGDLPRSPNYSAKQCGLTDELWDFLREYCWAMAEQQRTSAEKCLSRLEHLKTRWEHEINSRGPDSRDEIEVTLPVIPKYARPLVDHRKPYVLSLSERFGVKIQVTTDNFKCLKIIGDRVNVGLAQTDILNDFNERTAAKASESLPVPGRLRGMLIGPKGESVKILEKEHKVRIRFVPEEVNIEGSLLGVTEVMDIFQTALQYHKRYDDIWELEVGQKVTRRLRRPDYRQRICTEIGLRELIVTSELSIKMRGSMIALQKGQTHFLRLQEQLDMETTIILTEDMHLLLPLVKGQAWFDIVSRCNGPSDPELQKELVQIRREEEQILLQGEPNLVQNLERELALEVERRREIVIGMEISRSYELHRDLLREGNIWGIQHETNTFILFPGGTLRETLPEPSNYIDLLEADSRDIVKIRGTLQACTAARVLLEERVERERRLRRGLCFGAKYHHDVHDIVMPKLRDMGIRIIFSAPPPSPLRPLSPHAPPSQSTQPSWELTRRFDLEDAERIIWKLRASTGDYLERGKLIVTEAVHKVSAASYLGQLTFGTNRSFGQIVGPRGETVQRLQDETMTRIDVPPLGNTSTTVKITGPKKNVEQAKDKILGLLGAKWMTVADVMML